MSFFLNSRPLRSVRPSKDGWMPRLWASRLPLRRIDNFVEVFRALWENRDNLPYALRILQHGVCDGCALGTTGLRDWTIDGVHLCNVRLRLLRLNTIKPFDPALLADVAPLREMRARDLRGLGRLATPMIRKRGERGFRRIGWEYALDLIVNAIRQTTPERTYTYLTSRGIPNETYYAAQKAVRSMGSSNLDNAARICHSPSTYGLRDALGVGATTCSYSDLIGTDLITFIGSNPAANQPVMMKYLYHAKRAGTQIALVNPFREPAMEQYWIPSEVESALFGTRFTDDFFQIRAGGDIAFLHGAVKHILAQGRYDAAFVAAHTAGFDALKAYVESLSWEELEAQSGVSATQMQAYGDLVASAERAVFVWGMGITHHTSGEDNVHAIINLALLRGFVGREGCGLMPIRGHSGVQGGAEMGAYATALPGGLPVNAANAAALSAHYGFDVPATAGMTTSEMLDAAAKGDIDVLFAIGGNFREVMPDPDATSDGIERIPLRVHMDITLSTQMLLDPTDTVLILPALTRYEIDGGVTQTSTERRVIYSPRIKSKRPPDARSEWEVLGEIAARVKPELADKVRFVSTRAIRAEIAQVIPQYAGIEKLEREGDHFQYGGGLLCKDWQFPTLDGKAHFYAAPLPEHALAPNELVLVTRRGKQFNSMVHEDKESATGYGRDAVLISAADARRLHLTQGESVQLSNDVGSYSGRVQIADLATGMVQVYWPEANALLDTHTRSPKATVPAYKGGRVRLARATQTEPAEPAIKV